MKIVRNSPDFFAGLMFMFFGIGAMALSACYTIGMAAKMGPGYFPFVLGALLAILGLVIAARSLTRKQGAEKTLSFRVRPPVLVLSSVVLFGLLLERIGLLPSTVLLVIVSSMASDELRMREAILSAAVLLVVVLVIFVYFLKFPIPLWPSFLSGRA